MNVNEMTEQRSNLQQFPKWSLLRTLTKIVFGSSTLPGESKQSVREQKQHNGLTSLRFLGLALDLRVRARHRNFAPFELRAENVRSNEEGRDDQRKIKGRGGLGTGDNRYRGVVQASAGVVHRFLRARERKRERDISSWTRKQTGTTR